MIGKKVFKIGIVICSFAFFLIGTAAWDNAFADCKGWQGIPTITVKLPDKGEIRCKKGCAKKDAAQPCVKNKKGCHRPCSRYLSIGVDDIEKFHGNIGPGVAIGYRACQIAFSRLYPGEIPPRGDQFVVSGSNKACPADSVSFITGARYGKASKDAFNGNLAFDASVGSFSFIFASMSSGKAIKLQNKFEFPKEFKSLKAKMATDPEAKATFFRMSRCLSRQILTAPEKEIFEITPASDFSWKEYKDNYLK
jgi:formylmethanofuran dehydrogenase subunit E